MAGGHGGVPAPGGSRWLPVAPGVAVLGWGWGQLTATPMSPGQAGGMGGVAAVRGDAGADGTACAVPCCANPCRPVLCQSVRRGAALSRSLPWQRKGGGHRAVRAHPAPAPGGSSLPTR